MSYSDPLRVGLRSLRETLAGTPIGYVNVILSTALIIIETIQISKDVDNDLQRLALRVLELSMACSESMARSYHESESRDLHLYAGVFIQSLENIATAINKVPRRGFIGRIAGKLAKTKSLRDLEEQLEHSSALLSLHLQVKNQQLTKALGDATNVHRAEFQDAIAIAQKEQLDLIRTRMIKASERRREESTFSHYPPPPPQHFFGRDDHVQQLVTCFQTVPSYQAILGPGGIGKTCLSLRVFHDPRTISVYGMHRYFLSCESIQDADGLAAGLANIFDLEEKNIVAQLKRICSVIGKSILFLLDNFETPWERSDGRQKVEEILTELAAIPNLSLVITLRGGERPAGVAWTQPFSPILEPITMDASKQLFLSISDVDDSDPCLEDLLIAVEGLPLAVTLLANLAQSSNCSMILSAWEEQKTSMVTRGFDSRLSSLDASINLSITSSRMISVPSALPTLQVLSFLPDGATHKDLALMNPGQAQTALGAITLSQVSLAYFTDNGSIRALSPIREFVRANYLPELELFERVFNYHREASHYAAECGKTPNWAEMVERLSSHIGNIHSVIREALLRESLVFRGIQAAIDVASFHNRAFLGSIEALLNACLVRARTFKFQMLEADCLHKLALIHFGSPASQESWTEAICIYRELGETDSLAEALFRSARNATNTLQFSLAESKLTEAAEILSNRSPVSHQLELLMAFARVFTYTGDYSSAQEKYDAALLLIGPQTDPWLARDLHSCLCFHYVYSDKYNAAIGAGQNGLAVPGLRNHWVNIPVYCNMAVAFFALGRTSEAEETASTAFEISLQSARIYHMAWTKYFRAHFAVSNQKLDEAESHVQGAWVLSQWMGDDILNIRLLSVLGQIELSRNNAATAHAHLDEAKRIDLKIGSTDAAVTMLYLQPKAFLLSRSGMARSSMTYSICCIVACPDETPGTDTATALMCIGDAYLLDEDSDVITAKSCYDVSFGLVHKLGNRRLVAHALVRLAVVDRLESQSGSDSGRMTRQFSEVTKIFQEIGHSAAEKYCLDQIQSIEGDGTMDLPSLLAIPYPL